MTKREVQMSETLLLGSLLAAAGGYLESYTYLARGQVFANAQTGNVVMLALRLLAGDWWAALASFVPIIAFVLGVWLAESIRRRFSRTASSRLHWRQAVLAGEIAVLLAVACFPHNGFWDAAACCAVAFVCSLQVQSFRKVRGSAFATTMCTGNLRSAAALYYQGHLNHDREETRKAARYGVVILAFMGGVIVGAAVTRHWMTRASIGCCLLLAAAGLLMAIQPAAQEKGEHR